MNTHLPYNPSHDIDTTRVRAFACAGCAAGALWLFLEFGFRGASALGIGLAGAGCCVWWALMLGARKRIRNPSGYSFLRLEPTALIRGLEGATDRWAWHDIIDITVDEEKLHVEIHLAAGTSVGLPAHYGTFGAYGLADHLLRYREFCVEVQLAPRHRPNE